MKLLLARIAKKIYHPPLVFNNTSVSHSSSRKHVGVILDSKLVSVKHLKTISIKISKSESQPLFLIALASSHNRCSVISKTPCSFHSCIIRYLYPLIDLWSLSKGLLLKKHSMTILFPFLDHFVLTVAGLRPGPHC